MGRPTTHEEQILLPARRLLDSLVRTHSEKLLVLEAIASKVGGFSFVGFQRLFHRSVRNAASIQTAADSVLEAIRKTSIPIPLVVASLAREPVSESKQKETGAFYTDYRLAQLVAEQVLSSLNENTTVADLSSGTGILLASIATAFRNRHGGLAEKWIADNLFAFDLSKNAIRGTIASLSCCLSTINSVRRLSSHCKVCDSLLTKSRRMFDVIIGNPPWGRMRLTRYSFAKNGNATIVYGGDYGNLDEGALARSRTALDTYVRQVQKRFPLMGAAEPDFYIAFLAAILKKLKPGGMFSVIVPAGLIRSQGTEPLRRHLFSHVESPSFKLLDNKPCFFSIDTRFKFLVFSGVSTKPENNNVISLSFLRRDGPKIGFSSPVRFQLDELETIRPDLSIPECRTNAEKELFAKVCANGIRLSAFSKNIRIMREIDMTLGRNKFLSGKQRGSLPVVEGRMIQPHRFGAKSYQSGSGRTAVWRPSLYGGSPQFSIRRESIPNEVRPRIAIPRAGFCDIAGQTNERAMMSAVIPPGVICGNKVPTITFDDGNDWKSLFLWIGISNSFVFDWLLRRTLTTTVNFFLLDSVPLPSFSHNSREARTIIRETMALASMKKEFFTNNLAMSRRRAKIDAAAARAYGISEKELMLVLTDFPLLDRGQPPLPNEPRSTITKDLLLSIFSSGISKKRFAFRVRKAKALGAKAYVPSEMKQLAKRD